MHLYIKRRFREIWFKKVHKNDLTFTKKCKFQYSTETCILMKHGWFTFVSQIAFEAFGYRKNFH